MIEFLIGLFIGWLVAFIFVIGVSVSILENEE